jgi:hypothetical protein
MLNSISVLIPTCNRKKFLKKQLFLINEYSANYKKYIEILIGDNSNTKNNYLSCKEVNLLNNNFFYIKNKGNIGLKENIINLSKKAKNKYLWILSDDDFVKKKAFEKIFQYLNEKNNVNYLFFNYDQHNIKDRLTSEIKIFKNDLFQSGYDFNINYFKHLNFISNYIFSRKNFLEILNKINKKYITDVYPHLIIHLKCINKYGRVHTIEDSLLIETVNNKVMTGEEGLKSLLEQFKICGLLKDIRIDNKIINNFTNNLFLDLKTATKFFIYCKYFNSKYSLFYFIFIKKIFYMNKINFFVKFKVFLNYLFYFFLTKVKFFSFLYYHLIIRDKFFKKAVLGAMDYNNDKKKNNKVPTVYTAN